MARGRIRDRESARGNNQRLRKWSVLFAVKLLIFLTIEAECGWKWWPVFHIQINSVLILELFMEAIWANLSTCERTHVYGWCDCWCAAHSSAKNMNAGLFSYLWRFIPLSQHTQPVQKLLFVPALNIYSYIFAAIICYYYCYHYYRHHW